MERSSSVSERPTLAVAAGARAVFPPRTRESGTLAIGDRRRAPRVDVGLEVSIGQDSHYFTAQSTDLSAAGVFVVTYRVLDPGIELSIEFDLPAGRVMAKGTVCRSRDATPAVAPGYGIVFTELSRFDRTLIESYCTARKDRQSEAALAG